MADWRVFAACRDLDPVAFFPFPGQEVEIATATAVCYTCPVRAECLDYARSQKIEHGIWGGVFLEKPNGRRRKVVRCSRCGSADLFRWKGKIECSECSFSWAG